MLTLGPPRGTTLPDPVERLSFKIDPYANDPGHWGASLVNVAEVMIGCLDAVGARSVVEVGAYAGDLTGLLVQWAQGADAQVIAVDPFPKEELVALSEEHPQLELVRETSLEALEHVPLPDVMIIDGDHNYWTVTQEVQKVSSEAQGGDLPLLMFHDVCWPHGRRDDYYDPKMVPEEHRQPYEDGAGLFPGIEGVRPGGLPYHWPASREGGPRNGVLTAVEDFVDGTEGLQLAVVPAFYGLGVVWHEDAPWADAVAETLEPWDRNPLLERLESNRVAHLATSYYNICELAKLGERLSRQQLLLQRLLDSSAFSVAERLSRLRLRLGIGTHQSEISKDDIRRALSD
jgi:hypothetical protein